jgi:hypothetical protein
MRADGRSDGGRPFRPPVGLPRSPHERRWRAAIVSVALHVAAALLLLVPAIAALIVHVSAGRSAGSAGLRGGGGGGHLQERLHYVQTPAAVPPPPAPRPVPAPVVRPPEPKPPPPPTSSVPVPDSSAVAQAPGDGAGHNGPGTGGGTGAGAGTGVGNVAGPGTGGAPEATKIRAATDVMTLATIDPPKRPRPFRLHAVFAVDAHGDARLLTVNKADDGDFNRAMETRLKETHFKPATLPNGTPVPDTVSIDIDY